MFERFERPLKIICLAMAALLVWQLAGLILRANPLAKLKIPALPTLANSTNDVAKPAQKNTNALAAIATNPTNAASGTHATNGTNIAQGTNLANGTNIVQGTNATPKSTNAVAADVAAQTNAGAGAKPASPHKPAPPGGMPGMPPGMMAMMMGGGMPGGPMGGGMKPIELPPEVQARVDTIIDSELLGPVIRPMPMALIGIADKEAFIRATNGQTGPVKVGGEIGGIKLLRIGVNRVLVESGGETNELTLFNGIGGESLMPKPTNAPGTNTASTNAPSTNAPARSASIRHAQGTASAAPIL